jgi:hypothetical protein
MDQEPESKVKQNYFTMSRSLIPPLCVLCLRAVGPHGCNPETEFGDKTPASSKLLHLVALPFRCRKPKTRKTTTTTIHNCSLHRGDLPFCVVMPA